MLEEIIRKHALKNAFEHGKASPKGIVGKVIAEFPECKENMQKTMAQISGIVEEVNALSKDEIESQMKGFSYFERKEESKKFRIDGIVPGQVVTRFLPEPNGYLHIGHAKAAFLSKELANQYGGKCILRFDDTNPDAEKLEFVDAIRENLKWLGLEFASENYTSDRMPQLYKFCEKMLILGKAYACSCSKEEMNKNRYSGTECDCRNRRSAENFSIFGRMQKGLVEKGEMVIRLKGDMKSENTVMRDPTLFRVIKTTHYRQGDKYPVWPTYDFEVSISDSLDGITHALRSKEYELRDELYYAILDAVNMRRPLVYDFSRLNIKGTLLSKRFLKPLIEQKKVLGWDDPRLPTLDGLKRRGILPLAIKEFVLRQGLSKVESEPEFADLLAINRKMLDPIAPHYFFVAKPIKLKVKNIPPEMLNKEIGLPMHANGAKRIIVILDEFLISDSDAKTLKNGEAYRLKDLFGIKITKIGKTVIAAEYIEGNTTGNAAGIKKIHWVGAGESNSIKCEILQAGNLVDEKGAFNESSLQIIKGYCENSCNDLTIGTTVQFERFGFCRLDGKSLDGTLKFIFTC